MSLWDKPYEGRQPVPNRYIVTWDTGQKMLECPECENRIQAYPFTYAVGNLGYRFCPYCGENVQKQEQMSIFDYGETT